MYSTLCVKTLSINYLKLSLMVFVDLALFYHTMRVFEFSDKDIIYLLMHPLKIETLKNKDYRHDPF